jgi:hypothetical protein
VNITSQLKKDLANMTKGFEMGRLIILDYFSGPWASLSEERRGRHEGRREANVTMEGETKPMELQVKEQPQPPPKLEEARNSRRKQPCQHLSASPIRFISDSWLPEL